jgi:hypothetical protein
MKYLDLCKPLLQHSKSKTEKKTFYKKIELSAKNLEISPDVAIQFQIWFKSGLLQNILFVS